MSRHVHPAGRRLQALPRWQPTGWKSVCDLGRRRHRESGRGRYAGRTGDAHSDVGDATGNAATDASAADAASEGGRSDGNPDQPDAGDRSSDARDAATDAHVTVTGLDDAGSVSVNDAGSSGPGRDAIIDVPPQCVPSAEACFNGKDDDCDGRVDCDDLDCVAGSVCAADGVQVGVLVAAGSACPNGYTKATSALHRDLTAGGCTGCQCGTPSAATCSAKLLMYPQDETQPASLAPCSNSNPIRSTQVTSFSCTEEPPLGGFFVGASVESIATTAGTCTPQGQPTLAPATWGDTKEFCVAQTKGAGCGSGRVCVPRSTAQATMCSEPTSGVCAAGQQSQTWYTNMSDTRRCSPCSCKTDGASCSGVQVMVGYDWRCDEAVSGVLSVGQKLCGGPNSAVFAFTPGLRLVGSPTNGTCQASSSVTGMATMTGGKTLCCN